ncbi:MAG: MotA/TolQ/ExbB proton channel family protein [Lachnospiraceae bacterium]|nr:MotA/TolQ/ExbB proton channel family protein [Lachnospiraceae bacterium]
MIKIMGTIGTILSPVICVLAVGVLIFLVTLSNQFKELKKKVEDHIQGNKGRVYRNQKTLDLKQRDTAIAKREDTYPLRKSFDELCAKYLTVAQMIPVFPLLGILGTVAGLIAQVQAADAAQIYASLDVALMTTFWGLVAAIVLKVVETWLVLREINDIETIFNDYDIKYQDAVDIRDSENEEQEKS